jgi:hypothetical protein
MPHSATVKRGSTLKRRQIPSSRTRLSASWRRALSMRCVVTTLSRYSPNVSCRSGCLRSSSMTCGELSVAQRNVDRGCPDSAPQPPGAPRRKVKNHFGGCRRRPIAPDATSKGGKDKPPAHAERRHQRTLALRSPLLPQPRRARNDGGRPGRIPLPPPPGAARFGSASNRLVSMLFRPRWPILPV